jgi:uncharacterized protein (UPF0332 family)
MTLVNFLADGRLRRHSATAKEIRDLLKLVDRDFHDADLLGLSTDRAFSSAYNAVLQLATIVVRAAGYRTSGVAHHWTTFQVLPLILDSCDLERADYFDSCRRKRNRADYDAVGLISESEVDELLQEARVFRKEVRDWLKRKHRHLVGHDS